MTTNATLKISTTIETITPKMAQNYLDRNTINRDVRLAHELTMADDMANELWELNGESVIFDTEGNLVDGQHRLRACVRANTPFRTVVVRGVDPVRGRITIDTGKTRTPGDVLKMHGMENGAILAASARALDYLRWSQPVESSSYQRRSTSDLSSRTALLNYIEANPMIQKSVSVLYDKNNNKVFRFHLVSATWVEFAMVDTEENATNFWLSVIRGTELSETDPRWMLRDRFERNALNRRGILTRGSGTRALNNKADAMRLIVRAWNYWVTKTPVEKLMIGKGESKQTSIPRICDRHNNARDVRNSGTRERAEAS